MRTDSNTVLPLPSGVSSKKSTMIKVPAEKGANFHADFQQAKNAANASSTASSPTTADASTGSLNGTEVLQKNTTEQNGQSTATTVTNSSSNVSGESSVNDTADTSKNIAQQPPQQALPSAKLVTQSGNTLQDKGDKTPRTTPLSTLDTSLTSDLTAEKLNITHASALDSNVLEPNSVEPKVESVPVALHDQGQYQNDVLVKPGNIQDAPIENRLVSVAATTSSGVVGSGIKATAEAESLTLHSNASKPTDSVPVNSGATISDFNTEGLLATGLPESELLSDEEASLANSASASASVLQPIQSNGVVQDDASLLSVSAPVLAGAVNTDGNVEKEVLDNSEKSRSNQASPATLAALTDLVKADQSAKKGALNETVQTTDKIDLAPLYSPDELSWVLSQMSASTNKSAPNTVNDAVLANSAAALSSTRASALPVSDSTKTVGLLGAGLALNEEEVAAEAGDMVLEDGVLMNEPVELRKKEQDAMLGRISAQSDVLVGDKSRSDEVETGGLTSSLQATSTRPAAAAGILNAATNSPQSNAMTMSVPPGHPGWAGEMTQKVAWVARDGGHTAHIRLDPPELGSLTVKVSVDSDSNTQVSFVAATPQARDLLESQMGRLRDMLAQQGMDLSRADVDVSQQDTAGAQYKDNDRNNNGARNGSMAGDESVEDDLIAANTSYVSASGVDYYA